MGHLAELVMGPTQVVGRAKQVHSCLQWTQAASALTTFARQDGKPLTHGGIQAFNESGIEHVASFRLLQEPLSLLL
jgi:hypothetical protein